MGAADLVRVVPENNLGFDGEAALEWELVEVGVDWDVDVSSRECLLLHIHGEVFSDASPPPLQPLLMVTTLDRQSCVDQVN